MNDLQAKWDAIYQAAHQPGPPTEVLAEHPFLLPAEGSALDLACGLGGNALFLAEQGLRVQAWDISARALEILASHAKLRSLDITCRQHRIEADSLRNQLFDVIVISRFLDRTLCNAIMTALKPEGLLFYQTFIRDKPEPIGPSNPAFLLNRNELLQLFAPLTPVYYREYARTGDLRRGRRNEAAFIGQNTNLDSTP
ncbi:class I SAM-dependent methyltransferase [Methylomonas sp. CM2]|uniref:class I SAM-dependent methyltransferase n=1 Tax=Methylomonas sp. CM2 TaxID=3417647 RepID=UPI003CF88CC5